jgi:hypothetical protein
VARSQIPRARFADYGLRKLSSRPAESIHQILGPLRLSVKRKNFVLLPVAENGVIYCSITSGVNEPQSPRSTSWTLVDFYEETVFRNLADPFSIRSLMPRRAIAFGSFLEKNNTSQQKADRHDVSPRSRFLRIMHVSPRGCSHRRIL